MEPPAVNPHATVDRPPGAAVSPLTATVEETPIDQTPAPSVGRVLGFVLLTLMIVAGVGGGVVWLLAGRET